MIGSWCKSNCQVNIDGIIIKSFASSHYFVNFFRIVYTFDDDIEVHIIIFKIFANQFVFSFKLLCTVQVFYDIYTVGTRTFYVQYVGYTTSVKNRFIRLQ